MQTVGSGSQEARALVRRSFVALGVLVASVSLSLSGVHAAGIMPHTGLRHSASLRVTNIAATSGNTTATVTWNAPANLGDKPVIRYTVQAYYKSPTTQQRTVKSTVSVDGTQTSALVTNLSNGMAYDFTITAVNASAWFAVNTNIMVRPSGLPCTPTGVTVQPGNGKATIKWSRPCTGGAPVSFTVRAYAGDQVVAVQANIPDNRGYPVATVLGLVNGATYTVTVMATNKNGSVTSSPSADFSPRKK